MLASEVIVKIPSTYEKGLASGDLFFFPSSVHSHPEANIQYEIRLCPALQKKPHLPTPHFEATEKPHDPFSPPYNPNLFVGYLRNEEQEQEYVVLVSAISYESPHDPLTVS